MTTLTLTCAAATRSDLRRALDRMYDRDDTIVRLSKRETLRGRGFALHFDERISAEDVRVQSHAIRRAVQLACGTTAISVDCE